MTRIVHHILISEEYDTPNEADRETVYDNVDQLIGENVLEWQHHIAAWGEKKKVFVHQCVCEAHLGSDVLFHYSHHMFLLLGHQGNGVRLAVFAYVLFPEKKKKESRIMRMMHDSNRCSISP